MEQTKKKKKSNRGGRRPGAGRKFEGEKYRIQLMLSKEQVDSFNGVQSVRKMLYSIWGQIITSKKSA